MRLERMVSREIVNIMRNSYTLTVNIQGAMPTYVSFKSLTLLPQTIAPDEQLEKRNRPADIQSMVIPALPRNTLRASRIHAGS